MPKTPEFTVCFIFITSRLYDNHAVLNLMLSEEAASPDAVALQSWFSRTVHKVSHAVKQGIHAGQGVCSRLGLSPEEARKYSHRYIIMNKE